MVQHYFRTKDEMVVFALAAVGERTRARLTDEVAALGPAPAPDAFVRALLVQQLPFDEARRIEGRVALAFYAYTARNPSVAVKLGEDDTQLADYVANLISRAQTAGAVLAHLDPGHTSAALLALVEGLGVRAAIGHQPPEDALAVLDTHLKTVFGVVPRP